MFYYYHYHYHYYHIHHTRIGSDEFMGCVTLGLKVGGQSRDHWYEMLEAPRRPVAQWYSLQEQQALHTGVTGVSNGGKCCLSHRQSTDDTSVSDIFPVDTKST